MCTHDASATVSEPTAPRRASRTQLGMLHVDGAPVKIRSVSGRDLHRPYSDVCPPIRTSVLSRAGDSAASRWCQVPDTLPSWITYMGSVEENTPLISLRTSHTREREHTRTLLLLYLAIFFLALASSLDSMSFNLFLNYACSEFQALSHLGTIMIAQQLVRAISKPPIARFADTMGRIATLVMCITLYAGGHAIMALAPSFRMLMLGTMIQSLGTTGVGVVLAVIMADTSSPQWRGFVIGLFNVPYILNFALTGPVVDGMLRAGGWRLGFGFWVVLVPLSAVPLLSLLMIGSRRASKHFPHLVESTLSSTRARHVVSQMDIVGTALISSALTLILLPVSMEGPRVLFDGLSLFRSDIPTGVMLLLVFGAWEMWTDTPLFPLSVVTHLGVSITCCIAALDFAGFYLSWTYLSSYVQILKNWDQVRTAYFITIQNVTSTITGVCVGMCMAYTRQLKRYMLIGLIFRLLGVALMICYRHTGHTAAVLLASQVLQGIGGGALSLTTQVAVQVHVEPSEIATVTAFELLTMDLGSALGSTIASALVMSQLPAALRARLPDRPASEIERIQGSLEEVLRHAPGSPMRAGIVDAWVYVMQWLCILSFLVQLPALALTFLAPKVDLHEERSLPSTARTNRTAGVPSFMTAPSLWRTQLVVHGEA